MSCVRLSTLAALTISACAGRAPLPAVAASMPVPAPVVVAMPELTPIPRTQCTPAIEGYALSSQGVIDLAGGIRKRLAECGKRIILVTQERDTLQVRAGELDRDLNSAQAWALTGKIGVGVVAALTVIAAVFIGKSVVAR